jgi:hypothetical protein
MAMSWRPAPAALVERFAALLPDDPRVERRTMFGYPCAFLGGNLFTGLFQERMMLRLPEPARAEFLRLAGAAVFEPMPGRPMREYVVVPAALIADTPGIGAWLSRALAFAASLPVKLPKGKGQANSTGAKRAPTRTGRAAKVARPKGGAAASRSRRAAARKGTTRKRVARKPARGEPARGKAAKQPKRRAKRSRTRR